jgi:hypothetical protein
VATYGCQAKNDANRHVGKPSEGTHRCQGLAEACACTRHTHVGRFGVPMPKTMPTSLPTRPGVLFRSFFQALPWARCPSSFLVAQAKMACQARLVGMPTWLPGLLHALVRSRWPFWGAQAQDGAKNPSGTTGGISVIFRGITPGMVSDFVFGCPSQNGMPTVSWWQAMSHQGMGKPWQRHPRRDTTPP